MCLFYLCFIAFKIFVISGLLLLNDWGVFFWHIYPLLVGCRILNINVESKKLKEL
ncbi:hypothetical protein NC99_42110 [Sunxiuqinia dokdonensis]|uniref:Uncharacterized protein n=1 Tax=Sunxiuqinia dokdonensis TaxID=1409788 RepID=A0A0L8V3B7_9BACT|nr:hypothetical protein NC99_42110 [Sunxiuqinia dokdonensis]